MPRAAQLLATRLATAVGAIALLAALALAVTGTLARRLPTPPRLPQAIAWAGTTAGGGRGGGPRPPPPAVAPAPARA
ncbi:hypothetical protein ACFXB5_20770, partial [Streptomyces sp. NPDC059455]